MQFGLPLRFLSLQPVVPFWLLLPLPFGVVRLLRGSRWRLVVIVVGVVAGVVPLSVSVVGKDDPTQSYMEYFRYGTWALPWIVLVAAEGMEAGVFQIGLVAGLQNNGLDLFFASRKQGHKSHRM